MSIMTARAMSLVEMKVYALHGWHTNTNIDYYINKNGWKPAIISVVDPNVEHPFVETDHIINLHYEDISMSYSSEKTWKPFEGDVIMSEEHAKKIIEFIVRHEELDEQYVLLVNCFAGKCRSAAIVEFARTLFDFDWALFKQLNPDIYPSAHNLRLLWKVWNKHYV